MSKKQAPFEVHISEDSLDVLNRPALNAPWRRFYATPLLLCLESVLFVLPLLPGKHGEPSLWHTLPADLSRQSIQIPITICLILYIGACILCIFFGIRSFIAYCSPPDRIHCDRSTLTVSRIRWFDFHNREWITHSYPLSQIAKMRFGRIVSNGRSKAPPIYGLRFCLNERTQWVLPGIKSRQANQVLEALKSLGVDVLARPKG